MKDKFIAKKIKELAQKIRKYYGKPINGSKVMRATKGKEIWQLDLEQALAEAWEEGVKIGLNKYAPKDNANHTWE